MNSTATVSLVWNPKSTGIKRTAVIRVIFNRKNKTYSAGCSTKLSKAEFDNPKLKLTKEVEKQTQENLNRAKVIVAELGQDFTFDEFHRRYKSSAFSGVGKAETNTDIFTIYTKYYEANPNLSLGTKNSYNTGLNWVLKYKPQAKIGDITKPFLDGLEKFIQDNSKSSPTISKASLGMYYRGLRAVYYYAKSTLGIPLSESNPFGSGQYLIKSARRVKKSITTEEFSKFLKYTTEDSNKQLAWDFFMLSFLCCGINAADIFAITNNRLQNNRLIFVRQKTENSSGIEEEHEIHLSDQAIDIIAKYGHYLPGSPEEYIFPFYKQGSGERQQKNARNRWLKKINKGLKLICEELKIRHYTFGNARHTFATSMRGRYDVAIISKLLAHKSIKTTQHYLDSLPNKLLDDVKNTLDSIVQEGAL